MCWIKVVEVFIFEGNDRCEYAIYVQYRLGFLRYRNGICRLENYTQVLEVSRLSIRVDVRITSFSFCTYALSLSFPVGGSNRSFPFLRFLSPQRAYEIHRFHTPPRILDLYQTHTLPHPYKQTPTRWHCRTSYCRPYR